VLFIGTQFSILYTLVAPRARVMAVKVHCVIFAAALSKRAVMVEGEKGKHGKFQTKCCGDECLPERQVKAVWCSWVEGSRATEESSFQ